MKKFIREDRMDSTNSLLLAEFYTATGYLERLLFAFTDLEKIHLTPRGKSQIQKLCQESAEFFVDSFKDLNFDLDDSIFETSKFKNHLKSFHQYIEAMIKLPFRSKQVERVLIDYINLIYRNCFEVHHYLCQSTQLEIQLPRTGLTMQEDIPSINNADDKKIPLFYLDFDNLQEILLNEKIINSPLSFLDLKREEKYDHFIHRGHFFIAQKNYDEARSQFIKARNYKETAEILTLIGWTFSLQDDLTQAKSYCMQAIQTDTQYGPAYNDYGNYILNEGNVKESLRWFELAKRAHNYQNREYPYINAGRAYVLMQQYEEGIKEFSLALTLAPHHEELHETVSKLKANLAKEREKKLYPNQNTNISENNHPQQY